MSDVQQPPDSDHASASVPVGRSCGPKGDVFDGPAAGASDDHGHDHHHDPDPDHDLDDDDAAAAAAAADLPLTMSASTVLRALPRDATAALAAAGTFARDKVVVRFKAVGAPPLAAGPGDVRRKIAATQKFDAVVAFVRRALRVGPTESVFLYVNSAFAPSLDEVVGNLHQCFRDANDQLNVSYSVTPAFG